MVASVLAFVRPSDRWAFFAVTLRIDEPFAVVAVVDDDAAVVGAAAVVVDGSFVVGNCWGNSEIPPSLIRAILRFVSYRRHVHVMHIERLRR